MGGKTIFIYSVFMLCEADFCVWVLSWGACFSSTLRLGRQSASPTLNLCMQPSQRNLLIAHYLFESLSALLLMEPTGDHLPQTSCVLSVSTVHGTQ